MAPETWATLRRAVDAVHTPVQQGEIYSFRSLFEHDEEEAEAVVDAEEEKRGFLPFSAGDVTSFLSVLTSKWTRVRLSSSSECLFIL